MSDADFLQGPRRSGGDDRRDPGLEAPAGERRGLNVLERYELARQRAREQGKREPSFEEYAGPTFESATVKPRELETPAPSGRQSTEREEAEQ